jgi:hypothetical protein
LANSDKKGGVQTKIKNWVLPKDTNFCKLKPLITFANLTQPDQSSSTPAETYPHGSCSRKLVTAYSLQLTAYSLQLTAYSLQLTAYSSQLTPYSLQLTPYSLQLTAYSLQLTAYSLQLTATTVFITAIKGFILQAFDALVLLKVVYCFRFS